LADTVDDMSETTITPASEHSPAEVSGYRAFSPVAIASLTCGILSPLALIGPLLLLLPVLGVGLAILALRAIAQSRGELVGRRLALSGMALSLIFGTAGPAQSAATTARLSAAARPIADQFFAYLREGQPHFAHQLTMTANRRRALNENLWSYYGDTKENREELTNWVEQPVPRFLLDRGEQAEVRYYAPGAVVAGSDPQYVDLIYAVTYPTPSGKQSFFVRVTVERRNLPSGDVSWRIAGLEGGYRPPSYGN
jgi:hypothetical protein